MQRRRLRKHFPSRQHFATEIWQPNPKKFIADLNVRCHSHPSWIPSAKRHTDICSTLRCFICARGIGMWSGGVPLVGGAQLQSCDSTRRWQTASTIWRFSPSAISSDLKRSGSGRTSRTSVEFTGRSWSSVIAGFSTSMLQVEQLAHVDHDTRAPQRTAAPLCSRTVRVICQRLLQPHGRFRRRSLSLVAVQLWNPSSCFVKAMLFSQDILAAPYEKSWTRIESRGQRLRKGVWAGSFSGSRRAGSLHALQGRDVPDAGSSTQHIRRHAC